ncbi:APC family permease [Pseudarthrobacter sp. NamE2]|nr:APC family permease [Pseudarthrobacter sp. NamE2]
MTCVQPARRACARHRESWCEVSTRGDRFISPRSPVEGLRRRKLSFLPVFAQAVAAVAPAGAMSVIPALIFPGLALGTSGPNLLLTFGAAMTVMVMVSFCLRPMAKRMAAVSGLYSYTAKGFGQRTAISTGWSAVFGYALVAMASLLVVGTYLAEMLINLGVHLVDPKIVSLPIVLTAAVAACFLMVRGIRVSAWFTVLVECTSIGLLTVLMIVYFAFHSPEVNLGPVFQWNGNLDLLSVGIVIAVSAFVGFESPTTLGGEAQKPFVSVPRAITWTAVLAGVLYLLAATAQDLALRNAPASVTASPTPLSDLFSQASPAFAAVLDLGIAASWFACSIASMNALVRILFCMGREGVMPRLLGRAHPRFGTPSMAIMVTMPIVAFVPLAVILSGASPEQGLANLFMLGAYGYLGSYLLASASLPFFLRRIGEGTYVNWALAAVTCLALGAVLWTAAGVSIRTSNMQAFIYGGVLLASAVYASFLHYRRPQTLAGVGIYDETQEVDLFQGRPTQ